MYEVPALYLTLRLPVIRLATGVWNADDLIIETHYDILYLSCALSAVLRSTKSLIDMLAVCRRLAVILVMERVVIRGCERSQQALHHGKIRMFHCCFQSFFYAMVARDDGWIVRTH